jgi:transposase
MTISKDLRNRVLKFIEAGGQKTEASKRFSVSRTAIYQWLSGKLPNETSVKFRRKRKLDQAALKKHVQRYPDALLRERAEHFNVCINAIWYALREMKLTYKKSSQIQ